mmetsp:Transcript_11495/g.28308  ORF Transcript_11495/g.28308 Transcript_11495/m.28308 type:complete len:234 (-) Transcript_11495:211-912(-)
MRQPKRIMRNVYDMTRCGVPPLIPSRMRAGTEKHTKADTDIPQTYCLSMRNTTPYRIMLQTQAWSVMLLMKSLSSLLSLSVYEPEMPCTKNTTSIAKHASHCILSCVPPRIQGAIAIADKKVIETVSRRIPPSACRYSSHFVFLFSEFSEKISTNSNVMKTMNMPRGHLGRLFHDLSRLLLKSLSVSSSSYFPSDAIWTMWCTLDSFFRRTPVYVYLLIDLRAPVHLLSDFSM